MLIPFPKRQQVLNPEASQPGLVGVAPSLKSAPPGRQRHPENWGGLLTPGHVAGSRLKTQPHDTQGPASCPTFALASFKQAAFLSTQSERSIFGRRPIGACDGRKKGVKPNRSAITLEGKEGRKPSWRSGQ